MVDKGGYMHIIFSLTEFVEWLNKSNTESLHWN